ncbi:hypothetical protein KHS38_21355 [Mucilaginibacter sp. Bleaf8]|uniref:hypothetical protein n=1 Tax=Mucilaginibacter sp. Bleaf8 TaxID=2834430 RepID=UPI001BCF8003|nr:hypothetical protein [Mucilaginibacter sp. Bleaf8]MBS7566966.1 hypothetical protein [Mucilaginibacter sp. Bleaf8]
MAPVIADSFRLTSDTVDTKGTSIQMPYMALNDIKTTFSKAAQQMTLQMDSVRIHPHSVKVTGGTLKLLSSNWKPTERLDSSVVVVTLQNVYQFKGRRATWCSRLVYNYLNKKFILKRAEKVPYNN